MQPVPLPHPSRTKPIRAGRQGVAKERHSRRQDTATMLQKTAPAPRLPDCESDLINVLGGPWFEGRCPSSAAIERGRYSPATNKLSSQYRYCCMSIPWTLSGLFAVLVYPTPPSTLRRGAIQPRTKRTRSPRRSPVKGKFPHVVLTAASVRTKNSLVSVIAPASPLRPRAGPRRNMTITTKTHQYAVRHQRC
jgi:hypothetical protein